MLHRFTAAALVVLTGILSLGAVPERHRCLSMNREMPTSHSCCPKKNSNAPTELERPCCETIIGRAVEAMAPTVRAVPGLPIPQVIGVVEFVSRMGSSPVRGAISEALPRGHPPPGERLHQLSSILRV